MNFLHNPDVSVAARELHDNDRTGKRNATFTLPYLTLPYLTLPYSTVESHSTVFPHPIDIQEIHMLSGTKKCLSSFGKVSFVLFLGLLFFSFGLAYSEDGYTGEIPPVQIGSSCSGTSVYHWTTETKTAWELSSLIAVPDGYLPGEWDGLESFLNSMTARLAGNSELSTMAGAVLAVWQQSFQASARLYAKFDRSVTTETRDVDCSSGTWQIADPSIRVSTESESSEWVPIMIDPVPQSSVSAKGVAQTVTDLLTDVNSQPGADTRPFNFYSKVSE
jgi:hypothetical protein